MLQVALVVALFTAVACGGPAADPAPEWAAPERHQVVFVPADDELHALMVAADADWTTAGVHPDAVVVLAPGDSRPGAVPVEWRTMAELAAKCSPDGRSTIGCADLTGEGLLFASEAAGTKLTLIARHEMGHALGSGHAECVERTDAVMCDASRAGAFTQLDTDFICGSVSHPCD